MEDRLVKHIENLLYRYPKLESVKCDILNAYNILEKVYENDGKLLIAGNGGSAADAEHITGELMKSFKMPRPINEELANRLMEIDHIRGSKLIKDLEMPLTAISLTTHEAISTAYINDVDGLGVFAQQLLGFGKPGDAFLAISTSGNSENIIRATVVARAIKMKVIGLTGQNGGELADVADIVVKVPELETYRIQELHLPIYHCWCLMLEENFFYERKK